MSDHDGVLKVESVEQLREIVRVSIHIVAIPGLSRTAMTSAVMRDYAITALAEKQHLSVPIVGRERPAVAENDGLSFAPIFVKNLRSIFGWDGFQSNFSLIKNLSYAGHDAICDDQPVHQHSHPKIIYTHPSSGPNLFHVALL